jgi:hypothetical protein
MGRGIILLKDVKKLVALKLVRIMALQHNLVVKWNQKRIEDLIAILKVVNPSLRRSLLELIILLIHLLQCLIYKPLPPLPILLGLFSSLLFIKSLLAFHFNLLFIQLIHLILVRLLLFFSLRVVDIAGPFIIVCKTSLKHGL